MQIAEDALHRMQDRSGHPLVAERLGLPSASAPILLIHCWAGNRSLWRPHCGALAARHELLLPDLAGHGDSHRETRDWQLAALADDIADWVEHERMQGAVLVGHSMGGAVALEAAARLGRRASGVVLIDTFGMDYGHIPEAEIEGFCVSMRENLPAVIHQIVAATATDKTSTALQSVLTETLSTVAPDTAIAAWDSLLRWDPAPAFARCAAPIGMVRNDRMHPDAEARYAGHFRSERVMIGHGHFLQMEDPARFLAHLDEVLNDIAE